MNQLSWAREEYKFKLWAYVIMPDHVHLLIWPGERGHIISEVLHRIKGLTASIYKQHLVSQSPEMLDAYSFDFKGKKKFKFWQSGGGFDRNLWNAKPIHQSIGYIEGNPVQAGYVDEAEKWPWSSAWARKQKQGVVPNSGNIPTFMSS